MRAAKRARTAGIGSGAMQSSRAASKSARSEATPPALARGDAAHVRPRLATGARRASWALQLLAAAILAQTLVFKFGGAAESVFIFESLGVEPWGRWLSGVAELAAVLLLLVPGYAVLGALLTLGILSGALGAHVFVLGIEVQGDGGLLFALALVASAASAGVLALRRAELSAWIARARALRRGGRGARSL